MKELSATLFFVLFLGGVIVLIHHQAHIWL